MQYKVLTERDSRFAGRFDAETLEQALNAYANDGWKVLMGFTASSVWKSMKSTIMIVLEKESS
jgi:hypothetical protein